MAQPEEPQQPAEPEQLSPTPEPAQEDLHSLAAEPVSDPEAIPPPKPASVPQARKQTQQPVRRQPAKTAAHGEPFSVPLAVSAPAASAAVAVEPDPAPRSPAAPSPGWLAAVRLQLERNKGYPDSARARRQQGTAVLRFVVDRSGRVLSQTIVKSSGVPALDSAAEEMLRRASPVPPMPTEMASDRFELTIPVSFALQ
jgi:protein TonB